MELVDHFGELGPPLGLGSHHFEAWDDRFCPDFGPVRAWVLGGNGARLAKSGGGAPSGGVFDCGRLAHLQAKTDRVASNLLLKVLAALLALLSGNVMAFAFAGQIDHSGGVRHLRGPRGWRSGAQKGGPV